MIRKQLLILIVCLFAATSWSEAQPPTQQDINNAASTATRIQRDEQIRIEKDLERIKARRGKKNKIEIHEPGAGSKNKSTRCWLIKKIIIKGVTLLSKREQREILKNFTGRCLTLNQMNQLLNEITKAYFNKGYITSRSYLVPGQNLNSGILKLLVVEGKLEGIRLKDNKDNKSIALDFVFPGMVGKPLNLRDIEQGMDQISRLPSNQATMDIQPGSKPGSSLLIVKNKADSPFTYALGADNLGSRSTGQSQLSLSIFADNPMDMTDSFGLTFRRSLPLNNYNLANSVSANYSIPYGYNTLSLTGSFSNYVIRVPLASGAKAKSNGDTLNLSVTADRLLYRNQTDKLNVSATLRVSQNKNFLADTLIGVSSYNLTVVDLNAGYSTALGGGMLSASFKYSRGLDLFNARKDTVNKTASTARAQFNEYTYSLNYMKPFRIKPGLTMTLSSQLSGQQATDVLFGNEQFSIGGFYTIRGFQDVFLQGDTGYFARNNVSVNWQIGKFRIAPFWGFDIGRVTGHFGSNRGILSGTAYGIKMNYGKTELSITGASALHSTSFISPATSYLYLQFSSTI